MNPVVTFEMSRVERVIHGAGSVRALAGELEARGLSRAVLVTGRSVSQTAAYAAVREAAGARVAGEFTGVRAHNPIETLLELVEVAREAHADVLVAVGGGSPIDAVKLAALGVAENVRSTEELTDYAVRFEYPDKIVVKPFERRPMPTIAIPTTLSAAEWDGYAGSVDHERDLKLITGYLALTPSTVILDPEAAAETPRDLWAQTGVRALDHAVETSYSRSAHPVTTCLANGALGLLARHLPRSAADPSDLDAALQCQIAAWMSLVGLHNVSLGLSHAIGHQLGALGIPHGATSCIMLPHVMRHLEPLTRPQQAAMAAVLAEVQGEKGGPKAADRMEHLFTELGVPRRVSDFGISRDKMAGVARATLGDVIVRAAPGTVDEETVLRLLEAAW